MAETITEDFKQNLFCPPSGQKKTNPTIFDELRWAMQHSQRPLEQVMQLISEFHGPWTGMSQQLMDFISQVSSLGSSNTSSTYMNLAKSAMATLNSLVMVSKVGRINNINCNTMPIELLRQFVNRAQCLHPAVNTYIQMNIGKYPYFQQISESVCTFGQIVLNKNQVDPTKRINQDGDKNMKTSYRIRRNTNTKLFDNIKPLVDNSVNLVDVLFLRGMQIENNMSLLHGDYSTERPIAHGHNFTMDVFDMDRSKKSIQPCIMESSKKFGSSLRLCNWAFPVEQQIQKQPQWYMLETETGQYMADELNRPIVREPALPIASDDKKLAIV